MEDDSLERKDDHNHNYCASSSRGGSSSSTTSSSSSTTKARTYPRSQLSDVTGPPVPGGEPATRRRKRLPGSTGSKFMDSDSGSESSEVSETDSTVPPAAAAAQGKFSLDSTSKFRK